MWGDPVGSLFFLHAWVGPKRRHSCTWSTRHVGVDVPRYPTLDLFPLTPEASRDAEALIFSPRPDILNDHASVLGFNIGVHGVVVVR